MSRSPTLKIAIPVLQKWKTTTIAQDQIRDMMLATTKYQFAIKEDEDVTYTEQPVRKRKRLTDLSLEEKLKRKKLKNREAAQNSRDKKKAYVNSLEVTVNRLIEQNEQLKKKMDELCEQNRTLLVENARLEGLLAGGVTRTAENRPAVPVRPLQKDPCPVTPPVSSCHLLTILCLMNLIGWLIPSKHLTSWNWKSLQTLSQKQPSNFRMRRPVQQRRRHRWWGPSQKSWNPIPLAAHLILLKKILSLSQCRPMMC